MRSLTRFSFLLLLSPALLLADFSMDQTSQITGGAMAAMLRLAGAFSKQAREPIRSTVVVKGDRMAHLSANRAQIIDVAKETITTVDFQKKTYAVMTFAEMAQMLQQASEKLQQNDKADVNFKASVQSTGQTRQISGLEAKEVILKLEMEGQDKETGNKGAMVITSDMWMAPAVQGYQEVREFHKRMAQKLNWTPGANPMMMGRPDMAKGMADLYKEAAKMDGMPVMQVVKMGGTGMPQGQAQGGTPPPQQPQAQTPTAGDAAGGAVLGRLGRFGGLGGLGRRKKQQQEQNQGQAQQQTAPAAQPQGDASGTLLEMTIETSNFSTAPVDPAKFEVPAGFQQVQPETMRGGR